MPRESIGQKLRRYDNRIKAVLRREDIDPHSDTGRRIRLGKVAEMDCLLSGTDHIEQAMHELEPFIT